MKQLLGGLTAIVAIALIATFAMSQPPGGREGGGDRGPGGRGPGFGPLPNPIMEALDTNHDHEISAKEIENATASLKRLDKNDDGKLTHDEVHPFGPGGPGGFGPPPGEGPPPEGRDGRRGEGRGQGGGGDPSAFIDRIRSFDVNKDGKVTKDELPNRMLGLLDRHDTNEDGALDRKEIEQIAGPSGRDGDRPRDGRGGPGPAGPGPAGEGGLGGGPPSPERMVEHAMHFDADKDGKLDKDELLKFAEEMSRHRGPGDRGRGPEGGGEGEPRPPRPARPNVE